MIESGIIQTLFQGPGPGHYAPEASNKNVKGQKGFSMPGRNDNQVSYKTPGPGSYQKNSFAEKLGRMTMAKASRDNALVSKE